MIRRVRFGLAGTVGALALFVSLAAASPALATSCGGSPVDSIWNAVGSQAYVKTCLYFGWAGDSSKIASRVINAGEDQNTNSNEQLRERLHADVSVDKHHDPDRLLTV